jgi:putative flippase GtrA
VVAARLAALARSNHGRKAMKYSMVSAIAIVVSQTVLVVAHAILDWSPIVSNIVAVAVSSVPSYLLNRAWVWRKSGSHNLFREIVPFWTFAFVGLGLSVFFVWMAAKWSDATIVVSAANLSAFGILWVGRYIILDQLLFVALEHVHEEDEPVVV